LAFADYSSKFGSLFEKLSDPATNPISSEIVVSDTVPSVSEGILAHDLMKTPQNSAGPYELRLFLDNLLIGKECLKYVVGPGQPKSWS